MLNIYRGENMLPDFLTWLEENNTNMFSGMTAKIPQKGDMVVTATKTFFRGPKARSFFKTGAGPRRTHNDKINPWILTSDQKQGLQGDPEAEAAGLVGKTYYDATYIPNPSRKMKFTLDDIKSDVTDQYPDEDRYGKNVWLYIPTSKPELHSALSSKYNKMTAKKPIVPDSLGYEQLPSATLEHKVRLLGEARRLHYKYY